ncbi:MAG: hypothetical protein U0L88_13275 [Acutalibacteraceae bacterium]|nr:hypothetical protein [Acutalibacteraceae bacterium]
MVTLSVLKDKEKTARLFSEKGIEQNENSLCLVAFDGKNDLGFSLFDLNSDNAVIKYIEPLNDLSLADGILRSTLHIAAERFVMNVFYDDKTVPEDFFEKLGFIKDRQEKSLNIDKLFMSCGSCKSEG